MTLKRALGLGLGLVFGCAGLADDAGGISPTDSTDTKSRVDLVLSETCDGGTCHHLEVRCGDIPARDVVVREFSGGGDRGTVLFTTGVFGIKRYDEKPEHKVTIDVLRDKGFQVFQVEWGGGRRGWGTGAEGAGFGRTLCAYAQVVRWVLGNPARNSQVACSQGNSGGSLQNAYGLAVHGLEAELDLVVFSGGPPVTNVEKFCFGGNRESGAKESGRRFVEYVQGWNKAECEVGAARRNRLELARSDSLVDVLAEKDYEYTSTAVHFVLSERDRSHIEARRFHDAVESGKEWHWIPGHTHGVDATPAGSKLIRELFERDCRQN